MTTAERSALASSGQLPKTVPAPEVLINPATGQPYPAQPTTGPTPIPG